VATITGLTASRMLAIEAATIVDGDFDSAGHLILEKHDGTQIDVGHVADATTGAKGMVELATDAETQAGTDATRAVTPASLFSIPGNKVQILGTIPSESATPASYPLGISHMMLTGTEGWSINSSTGSVMTNRPHTDRTQQTFYSNPGGTGNPRAWVRYYHTSNNGGGWTAWRQQMIMNDLNTASFSQSTSFTSYPTGISRLYFTTSSSTGWDFAGLAGEIQTYSDGTDFAKQDFTSHVGGSSGVPVRWFRTANSASGWTNWQKVHVEFPASTQWTPTWTTSSGLRLPSLGNATVDCRYFKDGRKVDCKFEIVFGSSTNFGASPTTTDNWLFSLPVAAARTGDSMGFIHMQNGGTGTSMMMARAKTSTTTTFILSMAGGMFSGTPVNPGDVDSISPWTWASGDYLRGNFTYESAS